MKKTGKILTAVLVIALVTLIVWAIVGGEGNVAREILFGIGAAVFVVGGLGACAVTAWFSEPGGGSHTPRIPRKTDTGLVSCKKCGYLGVGHGACPRCGWNLIERITGDSKMISCMKCGYLGVGYGSCPRCGWTRIRKITK